MAAEHHSSMPPTGESQSPTLPAAKPGVPPPDKIVTLGSGRSLAITEEGGEERVEIRAAGGALLLAMRLTDAGPVFSLSGASFEIAAARTLTLRAETLCISASKDLTLEAGDTLHERAAGNATREIGGLDRTVARDVEVQAHPGGISLRANDDVDIVGERVRLNSDDPPMPQTWEEHRARHALLATAVPQDPASEGPEHDRGLRGLASLAAAPPGEPAEAIRSNDGDRSAGPKRTTGSADEP
jgi:hypothetical protein